MKKISTLLMLFCAFVCSAWAAPTDLPEMSTEGNIKYYTISNTRSTSGKYLYWTESGVKDANALKLSSLFYFTGTAEECYIHNAATDLLFTGAGAWNSTGVKCEISVTPYGDGTTGLAIKFSGTALNEANTNNGYTTWGADDEGSVFVMDVANVAQMAADYKTTANSALDMISFLGVDEAKATIANLEANIDAFAAVDAAVNGVAQYVTFRNSHNDNRKDFYLGVVMVNSKGNGHGTFNHLLDVWSLKYDGAGAFYLYNVNNEVYLGTPSSNGALTADPNASYTFEVVEGNKVKLQSAGQTVHLNNHNINGTVSTGWALSNYDNGDPASQWYVESDFSNLVSSYKNSVITELGGSISQLCTLLGVDASLAETTKSAIEAISTTDYPTLAAIDAELKTLTDVIAAKNVVFQNSNTTDANRSNVYLATDMSDNKGRGNKEFDYNAVWSLRHATGASFYLYNDLNQVYLGNPGGEGALTADPVAAYTFEIIENNKVELHTGGQTLHVHNWADCTLTNYDGDESASRWYITTIDITAELQELIDANASNYAEVPALGQYSKAGYDALVAAKNTAKTVEEVDAAIAAFKASLNRPVYFITSMHDGYAAGSAIYFDGAWKWKTANIYDKQMWMTIPGYTEENVPTVDAYDADGTSYEICDYTTGKVMRDKAVQIVAVPEWDGVFSLQYNANGESTDAAHHAASGGDLVNWKVAKVDDCQASAWKVEYIGNSYDLAQLSDELFTAAAELAAVNVPNFSFAAGVNNYNEATKPALDAAIAKRAEVLGKLSTVEEIAAAKSQLETAIDGVAINMPVNGKFYRVRCAGNGMKYLQSDLDDSNAEDIRLKVLSGATSVAATFCYVDGNLVSYTTGKSINAYRYDAVGTKSAVVFSEASNGKLGTYNINVGERYIFGASDNNKIDSGSGNPDARDGYTWWLEDVNEIPVTITAAGYATFYAPVALTLPSEVKAYTVTVNGESAMLNEIEDGVIPANTGVVLEAVAGTYNLTVAGSADAIADNELNGTVVASYVTDDAYALGLVDGVVGFYTATKNQQEGASWLNNGFKAYLPKPAGAAANALRFNFGGNTTAIESVLNNGVDANAPIYDLSGRRVNNAVKGGIYIKNGKKFIVK